MFKAGQTQHEKTKTVIIEHNPYAQKISEESLTKVLSRRFLKSNTANNIPYQEDEDEEDLG